MAPSAEASSTPLLAVRSLTHSYAAGSRRESPRESPRLDAVRDVTFEIPVGGTLGLVGETGSGKTTTARAVTRLLRPTSGRIEFDGQDLTRMSGRDLVAARRDLQMVFQDPYGSLNPRQRVGTIVGAPLRIHRLLSGDALQARVRELLQLVSLDAADTDRFPHEFSGGQRQRIAIARALALQPRLIVADEPVSALDVSVRAQIVNLLSRVNHDLGVALLVISHDLAVVRHLCSQIAVMQQGRIVEIGDRESICTAPQHPYTQRLIAAAQSRGHADPSPLRDA